MDSGHFKSNVNWNTNEFDANRPVTLHCPCPSKWHFTVEFRKTESQHESPSFSARKANQRLPSVLSHIPKSGAKQVVASFTPAFDRPNTAKWWIPTTRSNGVCALFVDGFRLSVRTFFSLISSVQYVFLCCAVSGSSRCYFYSSTWWSIRVPFVGCISGWCALRYRYIYHLWSPLVH